MDYLAQSDRYILTAVPFKSSNSPSAKSNFSDPLYVMVKTFLSYIKNGFTLDLLSFFIFFCKEEMISQVKQERIFIEETKIWLILRSILIHEKRPQKASQFIKTSPSDLLVCADGFKEKQRLLLFMVYLMLIKQNQYFNTYFSSNFQDLLLLSKNCIGYTGTLYNPEIFLNYENHFQFKLDESIAPFIIATLNMKNISIIEGSKNLRRASDLLDEIPNSIDCIIDAAGSLRYIAEDDLLDSIRLKYNKNSILFFRPESEALFVSLPSSVKILRNTDEKSVFSYAGPIENRFIIFDQFHCTGVDLKQHSNAIGLLTIGAKTILRDFLQAVMRMRDLSKGQRVFIFVENQALISFKGHLKKMESLTLADLVEYCLYMQNQKRGIELQTAIIQKFEAVDKLQVRLSEKSVESVVKSRNFGQVTASSLQRLENLFEERENCEITNYWIHQKHKLMSCLTAEITQTVIAEAVEVQQSVETQSQQAVETQQCLLNPTLSSRMIESPLNYVESFSFFKPDSIVLNGFKKHSLSPLGKFEFFVEDCELKYSKSVFLLRKEQDKFLIRLVSAHRVDDFLSRNLPLHDSTEILFLTDGDVVLPTRFTGNIISSTSESFELSAEDHEELKNFLFVIHLFYGDITPYLSPSTFPWLLKMIPLHRNEILKLVISDESRFLNKLILKKVKEEGCKDETLLPEKNSKDEIKWELLGKE